MSIQKITEEEILQNSIKNLPNRPSTPSLYSGNVLSAEELKDAFDKLPTLVARRFNALLASTGLFDGDNPANSFAELIATDLLPSHSLKDFFADVKNGNLASYLAADTEGTSLSDIISELHSKIDEKKSYTLSIEGDGDLLSDASIEDEHLTLKRNISVDDILARANEYADAPMGTVSKECMLPVSGKSVFDAMKEEAKEQNTRLDILENAANGILYTYPIAEEVFDYQFLLGEKLPNTALLRMGATSTSSINFFPEPTLALLSNDHLHITWDDVAKEIVFNGTLLAEDCPLKVVPFLKSYPYKKVFALNVFHRGGTISSENATIDAVAGSGETISVALCQSGYSIMNNFFRSGSTFSYIQLNTDEDVTFENYRINFSITRQWIIPKYDIMNTNFHFEIPRALTCIGPNHYMGEESISGETFVSIPMPGIEKIGDYIIGLKAKSNSGANRLVQFYTEDGICLQKKISTEKFKYYFLEALEKPVIEMRVYAADTIEKSEGYTVHVSNIYMEPIETDNDDDPIYQKGHMDEILFPESLSRFSERYIGLGNEKCAYFDFENGNFVSKYAFVTVDNSLDFVAEEGYTNRFSAPFSVPKELQSATEYTVSSIFSPLTSTNYSESLWFTEDRVYVQSTLFEGKSPLVLKWFFTHCPIDVAYALKSSQTTPLSREERDALTDLTLRIAPRAYLYFRDGENNPLKAYAKIQYQIRQSTEESE